MASTASAIAPSTSSKPLWTGRTLSTFAVLFLAFDTFGKLFKIPQVVEGTVQLGYAESAIVVIGIIELVCLLAYVIPQTAVFGAILLTGYLGGAVATHIRIGNPLFTHILFPIYVAAFIWGGLYLRERRLGQLVPIRK